MNNRATVTLDAVALAHPRCSWIAAGLALTLLVELACACQAQAVSIPDLEVAGPVAGFEMGSRLMTSAKSMEVTLSVPGKGTVRLPKFNGTFFYRHSRPEATSRSGNSPRNSSMTGQT